jgi:N-acetylglucosamine-6-phosphate deacetylase
MAHGTAVPLNEKVIVTNSLVGTGTPEGTVLTYKDGCKVYISEGVFRMIDDDPKINGNLTGNAVTMNVALLRLRDYTGLLVQEVVVWGSINPATTLGINGESGGIRVGKSADIVIIDENFNVNMTLLQGMPVFQAL